MASSEPIFMLRLAGPLLSFPRILERVPPLNGDASGFPALRATASAKAQAPRMPKLPIILFPTSG